MKQWFKDLVSESSTVSWMRVIGLIAVVFAIIFMIIDIAINKDIAQIWATLLSVAVGGKLVQKFAEKK